jgi:autotransporter translocation and assembly factor TamB
VKRVLVVAVGALLIALALLAGAVAFLAASESGTRLLAAQAERLLPVRFVDVSGTLWRQLRVGRVELDLDARQVRIDDLSVALSMWPLLFDNRLVLHRVTADAVVIELGESDDEDGPTPPLALPFMPVEIELTELALARLEVSGAFPMAIAASAAWRNDGVTVRSLTVTSAVITAQVSGTLGNGGDPDLGLQANWALPNTDWGGEGRIAGRVSDFALDHALRGPVTVTASGRGSLADVARPHVDVSVVVGDLQFGEVTVAAISGRLSGSPDNLSADARADVALPNIGPFEVTASAYGPFDGPLTVRNVRADALGGVQEAQGSFGWNPAVRLFLGGSVADIDLAALPGGQTGRLGAGFQLALVDGLVELQLSGLDGTFNDRPVTGELTAAQVHDGWRIDPLRLEVGDNALHGRVDVRDSDIDVSATVLAPTLAALGFGIDGDAAGSVELSGVWPRLSGRARARLA